MKYFVYIFFICIIASCINNQNKGEIVVEDSFDTIRAVVIELKEGWGYDITINGKPKIHQTIIPAIEGNYAFGSQEDAQIVANIVGEKVANDIFPPSVTEEELDSLGVLKNKIKL